MGMKCNRTVLGAIVFISTMALLWYLYLSLNPSKRGGNSHSTIKNYGTAVPGGGVGDKSTTCAKPVFQPSRWNDNGRAQKNNNCYAYATRNFNQNRSHRMGVGEEIGLGKITGEDYTCPKFEENLYKENPGLLKSDEDSDCPCNTYKIALFMDDNPDSKDFHFYRQDEDMSWSHKIGGLPATQLDASNNEIYHPRSADRNYTKYKKHYNSACGYYCAPYKQHEHLDKK